MSRADLDLSSQTGDEVKQTTCYMCACRCGINVHLKNGKVRYIEGNRDHPVNQGVLCAKGSAGIMHQNSPAKLTAPLLRTGPRGSGEFKQISWDEAMAVAVDWLKPIRQTDPKKLAFFTGRDQSQALTSWWAQQYGTPNYSAHGGFCSVNMAAAGIYTIGGAFWEFGEPDWDRTKLFVLFGVAEDHDSNPIKTGLGKLKQRGARVVSVNPIRTGYSAIADDWMAIRPGTDGLLILALIHELLRTRKIDLDYLVRYTNAPWLVQVAPGTERDGLFARGEDGEVLVCDSADGRLKSSTERVAAPKLSGEVELPDGTKAVPAFDLLARTYLDEKHAAENVAEQTGLSAERIRALAADLAKTAFEEKIVIEQPWTDWKGERHERFIGRPVTMHAMRGISAHSNGFQTCRALHILQVLLGSIDCPGGYRYKPPYPKPSTAHPTPTGISDSLTSDSPLQGPHLGYPQGPEDLLIEDDGTASRIDKAFSWDAPYSPHGLMHMVIANAHAGDPYPIDTLFLYMANMAWNSSMNTSAVIDMLEDKNPETGEYKIPHIIYSDAFASEMVSHADLILPDTTYLERHDCISLLDRPISGAEEAADSIRHPVVEPDRDVRPFQSVLIELGARLNLPGFVDESGNARYCDYADYIVNHERKPGIGPLAGWRGTDGTESGRGAANPDQLNRYIENGGFFATPIPEEARYFKHANQAYQDFAVEMGFFDAPQPVTFQLYLEPMQKLQLAADGLIAPSPPAHLADQIKMASDPLPVWYPPFEEQAVDTDTYPLHALTQRPMQMYHSWGSHNAWLRQILGTNYLFVPDKICADMDLEDGDWVWVVSHKGRVRVQVRPMRGVNDHTVWTWNAIGKRSGVWNLSKDAPEATTGFLLNHLIDELLPGANEPNRRLNSDPITGQAAWFDLRVRLEKISNADLPETSPKPASVMNLPGLSPAPEYVGDLGLDDTVEGADQ